MSNTAWLAVALIVIFAGIIGYSAGVVLRSRSLRKRLSERRKNRPKGA